MSFHEEILRNLFPCNTSLTKLADQNAGSIDSSGQEGNGVIDDSESGQLCNEEEEVTCAICLEVIDQRQVPSQGVCLHQFHQDCLMSWMLEDHDDCPTCRQPLWDKEQYRETEKRVRASNELKESTGSSTKYTSMMNRLTQRRYIALYMISMLIFCAGMFYIAWGVLMIAFY